LALPTLGTDALGRVVINTAATGEKTAKSRVIE